MDMIYTSGFHIHTELFIRKFEALAFLDNKKEITYEVMGGCQLTLIKENGDYTTASPLVRTPIKSRGK